MVVDVAAVGQRVQRTKRGCHGTADGQDVAPGVVGVLYNCHIAGVYNGDDIPLQVGHVVINRAVPFDRPRCTKSIIREVQRIGTFCHLSQLTTIVGVGISGSTITPALAHAVGIIGVRPSCGTVIEGCKLSAVLPCERLVAVGQRVANGIVGYGFSVVTGQQVTPTFTSPQGSLKRSPELISNSFLVIRYYYDVTNRRTLTS